MTQLYIISLYYAQLVDEQRRDLECEVHTVTPMKFQTPNSTLQLLVDQEQAQKRGWMVSLQSNRVCWIIIILLSGWRTIKLEDFVPIDGGVFIRTNTIIHNRP